MEEILKYCKEFKREAIEYWFKHSDIHCAEVQLLTALAAARKELEEQAWMPIAEAPPMKNVLLFGSRNKKCFAGRWVDYRTYNFPEVTHFRPLPKPPEGV